MFTLSVLLLLSCVALLYVVRYRHHEASVWSAQAAWCRAVMYFGACLLFAQFTGALQATLNSPVASAAQLASWAWWLSTLAVTAFIVAAYWLYWYRNTLRFGRPLQPVSQLIYGLAWGFTSGLLFLSFWYLVEGLAPDWPRWGIWLAAYGLISV